MVDWVEIGNARLALGDCRDILRTLPAESVDSIVTDPPYGLEFMGKDWDAPWKTDRRQTFDGTLNDQRENPYGRSKVRNGTGASYGADARIMRFFQEWCESWAVECLRVLKPGGHLLAFGGSRTYHRLASAVEDAGFEIRDQIMWIYGSGFPKSSNQTDDWEGWGTALKPAHEPIVVARKPLIGTVAANVLAHGTGALNIDGCRVGDFVNTTPSGVDRRNAKLAALGYRPGEYQQGETTPSGALGRWPANVIHDGSDEVLAAFPNAPGQIADASSSSRKTQNVYGSMARGNGRDGEDSADSENAGAVGFKMKPGARRLDAGSAARFFYCAKASRADRNAGLYGHEYVIFSLESQQESGEWAQEDRLARLLVDTGQSPPKVIGASGIAGKNAIEWSTSWFGSRLTAPSRPDLMCTTETATNSTTGLTTLSYFLSWLTSESTAAANCGPTGGGSRVESAANGTTSIITTNEKMASALGVVLAPSKTRLRISASAAVSDHPTVKPTALMRYLVRLVTPPNRTVLDPFTGSGSTGRACALEGMQFIGCELDPAYVAIANARIADARREAEQERRKADAIDRQSRLIA